jgi:prepilin-type N-terminal cleavage/methylation domain-containing protein
MPPRNRHARGFTLVEAVIVIAIMAILASAATPLLLQALTQQRTHRTRDMVRTAYEALVGARDRGVPNLMADVGFAPPALINDLRILTTRNPTGGWPTGPIPPAYPIAAAGFTWGWNGPYWTSPIQPQTGTNGLPTDGWGRPLRWSANQIQSRGADGVFGTADDVVYPPAPAGAPVSAQLQVTLERQLPPPAGPLPAAVTFTVQITDRSQQAIRARTAGVFSFTGSGVGTTAPLVVLPGLVLITVTSAVGNQSQTAALTPGETRVVLFRSNL